VYLIDVLGPKETMRPTPRLLTRMNRENTSPAWSPDGAKLVYSAKVDGIRQIWVYDFATQVESAITTGPENKENPSWAPDSLHLIYNTETEDRCELYRIHVQQKDPVLISKGSDQKRFASWSCFIPNAN
jgi:TolB protein